VGPTAIYKVFFSQTSTHHSGSPRRLFFKPSSATGSTSRHLHHGCPWATFLPEPPGRPFFISWPGTYVHCHIYLIHVHICYSLQILFTLGIWLFSVQVLGHHLFASFLQVYTQHWHVVSPAVFHLHSQSHPLILAFRIPIPGSAVLTPPVASSVLLPGSILTHMSCPIHSTFWHF
jgi:hypothetical protein